MRPRRTPKLVCWHDSRRVGAETELLVVADHQAARDPAWWSKRLPGARLTVWLHPEGYSTARGIRERHRLFELLGTERPVPPAPDAAATAAEVLVRVDGQVRRAVMTDGVFELVLEHRAVA